jgi:hypothetical protein
MIVGSNILAGASGQQGYFLNRSVRTRSSASAYFNRTPSASGSQTIWTYSGWVKRGILNVTPFLLSAAEPSGTTDYDAVDLSGDTLRIYFRGGNSAYLQTTQVLRDPSSWYHIVISVDTTQATSSNRIKLYINGVQVTAFAAATYPIQNYATYFNINGRKTTISANALPTPSGFYDGYQTEINFIDGQALTPTLFGAFDALTGVWQPKKYAGSYGTNGFYLNFNDNSAATAAAIGKDLSGNGNNWTPNNISVTAGVTYDSMTDVPTLTSPTQSNFPVFLPISSTACTPAQGNLYVSTTNGWAITFGSMALPLSGKFYWEYTNTATAILANQRAAVGFAYATSTSPRGSGTNYFGGVTGDQTYLGFNGSTPSGIYATWTTNDVIGICVDCNSGNYWYTKNGTSIYGDPVSGINPVGNLTGGASLYLPTFGNIANAGGYEFTGYVNFGQRPFNYTPPTGFVALNTYNLPTPTISNGATQMAATIYTGTGVAQNINNTVNGISFQPDLVWVKARSFAYSHRLANSITGATNYLDTAQTAAQFTDAGNSVSSFNSNGFGVGTYVSANNNTTTYVGWQWKASNAAAVTNTSGSISSQVSANPTAGFSIVTYTGTGANATVGHGLGIAPSMIIVKDRSGAGQNWGVYHSSLGNTGGLALNLTNSLITASGWWNNTSPTSSVFSLGGSTGSDWFTTNKSGDTYVAYCFSEIAGYSKFGSYTGNGSADGVFVYLGFRPRFLLYKQSSGVNAWVIVDSSRNTSNIVQNLLFPNLSNAESTVGVLDFLSNGFKLRNAGSGTNGSGETIIYAAFAENPFRNSLAR